MNKRLTFQENTNFGVIRLKKIRLSRNVELRLLPRTEPFSGQIRLYDFLCPKKGCVAKKGKRTEKQIAFAIKQVELGAKG